jgi:hypothetical protein
MYTLLDYFFVLFHGGLVLFNLTGWAWKKSRRLHLVVIVGTIFSWFGLGIFFGWGYCPSTEWHWQVKYRLGEIDLPNSYIKYYVDQITGVQWDPLLVDTATLILGLSAFVLSCLLNRRDWNQGKRFSSPSER